MIELRDDQLVFRFPEVHKDAVLRVGFQRTLRIPDDNRAYPLPPGLGSFPLEHLDDYADGVPQSWQRLAEYSSPCTKRRRCGSPSKRPTQWRLRWPQER